MKILVFGSREWTDSATIYRVLSKLPTDTVLVHGAARGADRLAGEIGNTLGFDVRPYPVPQSEWDQYGNAAGIMRNGRMLQAEHDPNGIRVDKGFGFSTGHHNKGTLNMSQRLWVALIRFEILFPSV